MKLKLIHNWTQTWSRSQLCSCNETLGYWQYCDPPKYHSSMSMIHTVVSFILFYSFPHPFSLDNVNAPHGSNIPPPRLLPSVVSLWKCCIQQPWRNVQGHSQTRRGEDVSCAGVLVEYSQLALYLCAALHWLIYFRIGNYPQPCFSISPDNCCKGNLIIC